jgi:membrane fusion protein (multidrug efflux system)
MAPPRTLPAAASRRQRERALRGFDLLVAVVLLGALSVCAGCGSGAVDEPAAETQARAVTVEVLTVEAQPLRDVATFSGQLDAEYSVTLKSETEGVVESIDFEEGQRVSEGQILIRLRNASQRAVLREAVATEALAHAEFLRTESLVTRDAASAAVKDRDVAELEVARARVDRARVELARTEIRAPFDGIAGFRMVSPGDFISDEVPLVEVTAIDRLQLSFALSDHAVAFARKGMKIEAQVAPYPGEKFPGEVFVVSPSVDPTTRRVILKAWVPNPDHRLRPGMFAETDLEVGRRDAAIVVPESAVVFDHQGTFVWRVSKHGSAERVPIQTGLRKGGVVEVTLGLHAGDTIITAGTHKVREGSPIAALPSGVAGQALGPVTTGEGT